jgi:hypothetical protein
MSKLYANGPHNVGLILPALSYRMLLSRHIYWNNGTSGCSNPTKTCALPQSWFPFTDADQICINRIHNQNQVPQSLYMLLNTPHQKTQDYNGSKWWQRTRTQEHPAIKYTWYMGKRAPIYRASKAIPLPVRTLVCAVRFCGQILWADSVVRFCPLKLF